MNETSYYAGLMCDDCMFLADSGPNYFDSPWYIPEYCNSGFTISNGKDFGLKCNVLIPKENPTVCHSCSKPLERGELAINMCCGCKSIISDE